ncbi:MAG: hypothetical protein AB7T49_05005 [Oligoflexales bacterium]
MTKILSRVLFATTLLASLGLSLFFNKQARAQEDEQSGELRQRVKHCGPDVQCVGSALVDAILYGLNSTNKDVEKARVSYFAGDTCNELVMVTDGHDGENIVQYCTEKTANLGDKQIKTFKVNNSPCYVLDPGLMTTGPLGQRAKSLCTTMAIELSPGATPTYLFENATCKRGMKGMLGSPGELSLEEYCAAKDAPALGEIKGIILNGHCTEVSPGTIKDICLQFAN